MRYPDSHKAEVRARIVEAASRALRREGIAGIGIPALMKKAGLTHGGFYAHFRDRDELVAEAAAFAANETAQRVFSEAPDWHSALSAYLSQQHVEHPEYGCVLAALGQDAARQRAPVRHAFGRIARGFLDLVENKLHPNKKKKAHWSDDTLALACRMIGGVVLARLVEDEALASRILAAARKGADPAPPHPHTID